jgi:hypothetical protein
MALPRRVETFVAGYIGFMAEATTVSAGIMDDLDAVVGATPNKQNFFVQDRTKQYMLISGTPVVRNGGTPVVNSGLTAFQTQKLGGIVRFNQPQTLTQTDDVQTLSDTSATAGNFQIVMTDGNGVQWTSLSIAWNAASAAIGTAIDGATPAVANPGYTNPFAGANIAETGGPLPATPVVLTGAAGLKGQYLPIFFVINSTVVGGSGPTIAHTTPGGTGITIDYSYVPMYFLRGAQSLNNNSTAQKIDTTGSGDLVTNAVPGRPDEEVTFTLKTGPKITLVSGKITTVENRLMQARRNGEVVVVSFIDDTTDPYQPRDVMYGFVGTASKTRQLNAAVERQITLYPAIPDDASSAVANIDYVA